MRTWIVCNEGFPWEFGPLWSMNNNKNYKKKWKRQSSRLDEFAKNVCKTILASCWQASFTIMRRTFERGTKARLSFSSGPHAPANMANSMEMPVVGLFLDPETMEIQKNFKDLRKFSVRNIAQSSAANVPFPACFSTDISSILSAMLACGAPEKLSLALMPRSYVCAWLWNWLIVWNLVPRAF